MSALSSFRHPVPSRFHHMVLVTALLLTALLPAASPLLAQGGDAVWQASFWNNNNLSGAPVLVRSESTLAFNWGSGSPAPEVQSDNFSARFTRNLSLDQAQLLRFTFKVDDGIRVFIDNELVFDAWTGYPQRTTVFDRTLSAGAHFIVVEFHEEQGAAMLNFSWQVQGSAQPTATPTATPVTGPSQANWKGEYFANRDLLGTPVLTREDGAIDFNWGNGSPAPAVVGADNFSVRWTRSINFPAGSYRFRATVDDGIRVFVNNQLVIDQWRQQGTASFTSNLIALNGNALVRVEYFDATGQALIRFGYDLAGSGGTGGPAPTPTPAPPSGQGGWLGEYFNNRDLAGGPILVRTDRDIDFNWNFDSPSPGVVNADNFSVRWTQTLFLAAGNYRFRLRVDDGGRLFVNNVAVIDQWRVQSATEFVADINLAGGFVPIRVEYFDGTEKASARLTWEFLGGNGQAPGPASTPTSVPGGWQGGDFNTSPTTTSVNAKKKYVGDYYANPDLSGAPAFVREDRRIDFDWGSGAPANNFPADNFSVRWTNTLKVNGGLYRFVAEVDDGVRLYVNDQLIIDKWGQSAAEKHEAELRLGKGEHTLRMEYVEYGGKAVARLRIYEVNQGSAPVGNLVTCVPPQPQNYAWIKLYRLDGNNQWYSIGRGIGSISASGFLKIDGLPIDVGRFGGAGEPYKIEQWIDGRVARSTGDFQRGEPEFRIRPFADNQTPWGCGR